MLFFDEADYTAVFFDLETISVVAGREDDFLSPGERERLCGIRAPNYRRSWLGGRFGAKTLWFRRDGLTNPFQDGSFDPGTWAEIDIVSRNAEKKGVRPVLRVAGKPIDRDVSITHSDSAVFVMLAKRPGIRVGCDIVPLGSVSPGVVNRFFTAEEVEAVAGSPEDLPDRIWAAKESAYKAGNEHDPFIPVRWQVSVREKNLFVCRSPDSKPFWVRTFLLAGHVVAVTPVLER